MLASVSPAEMTPGQARISPCSPDTQRFLTPLHPPNEKQGSKRLTEHAGPLLLLVWSAFLVFSSPDFSLSIWLCRVLVVALWLTVPGHAGS